jgi:S-adenosylmethionine uptake transporter
MVIAMLLMPGIDAIAKHLSTTVPAGQVTWARFAFQTIVLLPFLWRSIGRLAAQDILPQCIRGITLALATMFIFAAVQVMPIADAIAIFFVQPFMLVLISVVFLGETIGWRRYVAIFVGFIGAMLVVQPSWLVFGWTATLPLLAALSFAIYLAITRRQSQKYGPFALQFSVGLSGLGFMSLSLLIGDYVGFQPFDPVWASYSAWLWMALVGVISLLGHLAITAAFQRVAASVLAPLSYLEIIGATVFGLIFFDDFPSPLTGLGVLVIISSGLYIIHREGRAKQ